MDLYEIIRRQSLNTTLAVAAIRASQTSMPAVRTSSTSSSQTIPAVRR